MASEMAERIGSRIRERRLALGMKQRELADRLDSDAIDNQRISDWERGVNRPSDRYMDQLAEALERDVAWFLSENPDGPTPDLMGEMDGDIDRLARIERRLAQAEEDGAEMRRLIDRMGLRIDEQNVNLARQSELLEDIQKERAGIAETLRNIEALVAVIPSVDEVQELRRAIDGAG